MTFPKEVDRSLTCYARATQFQNAERPLLPYLGDCPIIPSPPQPPRQAHPLSGLILTRPPLSRPHRHLRAKLSSFLTGHLICLFGECVDRSLPEASFHSCLFVCGYIRTATVSRRSPLRVSVMLEERYFFPCAHADTGRIQDQVLVAEVRDE